MFVVLSFRMVVESLQVTTTPVPDGVAARGCLGLLRLPGLPGLPWLQGLLGPQPGAAHRLSL